MDDATAADETIITAIIELDTYTTSTPSVYGNSTYAVIVVLQGNITYMDGTPVIFLIGGYDAMD